MKRVVIDTNVLVSGVLSPSGPPGWIVELLVAGELTPVFDSAIIAEYHDVLIRPELSLSSARVEDLIDAIERLGTQLTVPPWPIALTDPDDAPFLSVASAADCVLVTGNLRHFPRSARSDVTVLSPREFLDRVSGR